MIEAASNVGLEPIWNNLLCFLLCFWCFHDVVNASEKFIWGIYWINISLDPSGYIGKLIHQSHNFNLSVSKTDYFLLLYIVFVYMLNTIITQLSSEKKLSHEKSYLGRKRLSCEKSYLVCSDKRKKLWSDRSQRS